ncbi:MAG TPA: DEAD/DEAH box helicase [Gemmatimonadales bacterium]|nr:DEAD/DEAH box helicase [Gemmatimonadales bacterium]
MQAQAIPVVLAGRDLIAAAQTGTGKTAAFTLPMLKLLEDRPLDHEHPRALVLVPTRELAAQVEESVRTYGRHLNPSTALIFGGVGFTPQVHDLKNGADIVVATPGRLLDHVGERTIDLSRVEILVLDEADRMLDMGFIHDIRKVLALLPSQRQNLLISATFPEEIRELAKTFMRDPQTVEVAPRNRPIELVSQLVHPVERDRKRALLSHLVKSGSWQQVLVFCRTKHGANRLAEQLERDGIETAAIHGNKSQPQRMKALARFKDREIQVLVATDIAARGLDIESLPHVVNYDLPHVPEDYVHRIGRTGRAGESGQAVSLVSGEDRDLLRDIERLIGKKIEQQVVPGFEPGAGYQNAQPQPQPQQQRGQQRQRQPQQQPQHRNDRRKPQSPMRGPQPQQQGQRRDPGRREQRSAFALPSEKNLEQVRREQLEYARQQAAAERHEEQPEAAPPQAAPSQAAAAPAQPQRLREPARQGKPVAALFSPIGRKTG